MKVVSIRINIKDVLMDNFLKDVSFVSLEVLSIGTIITYFLKKVNSSDLHRVLLGVFLGV